MTWYSSIPSDAMLDCWIKYSYNVLFHGRHGVGKTSMVADAFHRAGWKLGEDYLYFSASTIDPWVDLIGVPSKSINQEGEEVLKLIRPASINNKNIKAFFVDELNRSHNKVRNAMMELIQFKSINGLKFPNLRMIWGAVNPDNDDELKYDVQKLDPAQEDRFQIQVKIPYKPIQSYFAERFNNSEMAEAVCKWWNEQPEKVKLEITPRRLEYAIDVFQKTNDLRFVIPSEAHASSLKTAIQTGNPEKTFKKMLDESNEDEIRRWLAIDNNLTSVQNLICSERTISAKCLHLLSDERLVSFASKNKVIQDQMKADPKKYAKIIRDLAENSTQKMLKQMCVKLLPFLDGPELTLSKMYVGTKPVSNLNLTKRRKAQIISNYEINTSENICAIESNVKDRAEIIVSLATDCSFANNFHQRIEILEKLKNIISTDMLKPESDVCIKILENIVSYTDAESIPLIIKDYRSSINTIVVSWSNNHKFPSTAELLTIAPYLTTNILSVIADNNENNDNCFVKISNDNFDNIPEEMEYSRKQNVDNLF